MTVSKVFGAKKNAETRRNDRASGVLKVPITGETGSVQLQIPFFDPAQLALDLAEEDTERGGQDEAERKLGWIKEGDLKLN